jgi:hypothetical protein
MVLAIQALLSCAPKLRAAEAKHPPRDRTDEELDRPRRRRAGGVRHVHNAGGRRDVTIDGGPAAHLLSEPESNVEPPSGLVGYERDGDLIGEDEEADGYWPM